MLASGLGAEFISETPVLVIPHNPTIKVCLYPILENLLANAKMGG